MIRLSEYRGACLALALSTWHAWYVFEGKPEDKEKHQAFAFKIAITTRRKPTLCRSIVLVGNSTGPATDPAKARALLLIVVRKHQFHKKPPLFPQG